MFCLPFGFKPRRKRTLAILCTFAALLVPSLVPLLVPLLVVLLLGPFLVSFLGPFLVSFLVFRVGSCAFTTTRCTVSPDHPSEFGTIWQAFTARIENLLQ